MNRINSRTHTGRYTSYASSLLSSRWAAYIWGILSYYSWSNRYWPPMHWVAYTITSRPRRALGSEAIFGNGSSRASHKDRWLCLSTSCWASHRSRGISRWDSSKRLCFGLRSLRRSFFCLAIVVQARFYLKIIEGWVLYGMLEYSCIQRKYAHSSIAL